MLGINRNHWRCVCFALFFLITVVRALERDTDASSTTPARLHKNHARFFKVFSRASPESDKEVGVGLKRHIKNLLNGGSIGIFAEYRPDKKLLRALDHSKKFIPWFDEEKTNELETSNGLTPDDRRKPKSVGGSEVDDHDGASLDPRYVVRYQNEP